MSRNSVYVRVLLVIVAVVVFLAFINRSPEHSVKDAWLPSSFNPVGSGTMAFFQTLQETGWPVERWREPLSRLSAYGTGNVLIITRAQVSARASYSDQELDLLDDWVKKGNTLILLGALENWDDTRLFLEKHHLLLPEKRNSITALFQPFDLAAGQSIEIEPDPDAHEKGLMVLPPTPPFEFLGSPAPARTLWQLQGKPYVIDTASGSGHIIFGASARLLSNAYLGRGDNLSIVLGWLAPAGHVPAHVFFEETHHGFSAVYAVARLLSNRGVRFAGLLALLGLLAFTGSSLVRFGTIIPLHRETGRSTLEFVDSVADLYLRADLRDDTMKYLFDETHRQVLHRLNLPPGVSHELIASRLRQIDPRLPKWKKLAQRFDSPDYTEGLPPTGWLRVARELIEIKSAMA